MRVRFCLSHYHLNAILLPSKCVYFNEKIAFTDVAMMVLAPANTVM